ncbi:MAG: hypothetical protein FD155_1582 [Bacteroidetes bacterium]|nr:MAG: hypothetical protein FD155_1582 [Bacteroidota bacterium]
MIELKTSESIIALIGKSDKKAITPHQDNGSFVYLRCFST